MDERGIGSDSTTYTSMITASSPSAGSPRSSAGFCSAAGGSFSILRFADSDLPDIVYIEQLTGALYLDRPEEIDHYREVMNSLSAEAETPSESERQLKKLINTI